MFYISRFYNTSVSFLVTHLQNCHILSPPPPLLPPLLILRWYKEVDKNGKELEGYQNKECAAYKLMTNNDGVPFCWTSTIQIVSKIYLKKHSSQPRSYTLNKKDAKMVGTDVAKRVVVG